MDYTELKSRIYDAALTDDGFCRGMLASPVETLENAWNFRLPDSVRLQVVEIKEGRLDLVIPAAPETMSKKMPEAEMVAQLLADGPGEEDGSGTQEAYAVLVVRCWQSRAFCSRLRENPRAVMEREMAWSLPEELEIRVHVEEGPWIYVLLPPGHGELSPVELARVCGGVNGYSGSCPSSQILMSISNQLSTHKLITNTLLSHLCLMDKNGIG